MTGGGGQQVAVGVADQNSFSFEDPAKAATVFKKAMPREPKSGEVLVRWETWDALQCHADTSLYAW